MIYDIERIHAPKSGRRSGRTVEVLSMAIGLLMVTTNDVIYIVVPYMNRIRNLEREFRQLCADHFNEIPLFERKFEFKIVGFSSVIRIITDDQWWDKYQHLALQEPLFDD